MLTLIKIIIYVVLGYGAYWAMMKQDNMYTRKLTEAVGAGSVKRYYERKHYIHINNFNRFHAILSLVVIIAVWALWPIVTTVSMIWNYVDYKLTLNEGAVES